MDLNNKFDWQDIEGFFNFNELYDKFVQEAAEKDTIIEIGTWFGKSTCYLATQAKLANKSLKIIAVDHFIGSSNEPELLSKVAVHGGSIYDKFVENMTKAGVIDIIGVMAMNSLTAASKIENESAFAIYIDGNHQKANVCADVLAWYPKVKPGGYLAGHDIAMPEVREGLGQALDLLNIKECEIFSGVGEMLGNTTIDNTIYIWPSWLLRKPL
jgi:cephalosporin hydroxylase